MSPSPDVALVQRVWAALAAGELRVMEDALAPDAERLLDLAAEVVDIITKLDEVTMISLGYVQNGKGVTGGERRVKIGDCTGGVLLIVRQSRSIQELRVYGHNLQHTKLAIARALRNNDIPIGFRVSV